MELNEVKADIQDQLRVRGFAYLKSSIYEQHKEQLDLYFKVSSLSASPIVPGSHGVLIVTPEAGICIDCDD